MKIEGKIIDSKGEALALANITIQDGIRASKLGTSADLDGNFYLENEVIEPDSVFMISYIGYEPQLLKASELDGNEVMLLDAMEQIEKIVVMGRPSTASKKEKLNFKEYLVKHKNVYAGLGALAGVLLIMKSIKK
jgi:hypothetical protein